MKKRKNRYDVTVKPVKPKKITSYGGTFPVSKVETPLPSPNGDHQSFENSQ